MPNSPKTPARQIRVPDDIWLDAERATAAAGTDRATLWRDFLGWYLHRPGAKLPKRPDREVWSVRPGDDEPAAPAGGAG